MDKLFPFMLIVIFSLSAPCLFAEEISPETGTSSSSGYYMIGVSPYSVDGYASESNDSIGNKKVSYLPMFSFSSFWSSPKGNELHGVGISCGYNHLNNSSLLFDSQQHDYIIPWVALYLWKGIHFFSETKNSGFYISYDLGIEYLMIYKDNFKHCYVPENLALTLKYGGGYSFHMDKSSLLIGVETTFPYIPIFIFGKHNSNKFLATLGIYPYVSILW